MSEPANKEWPEKTENSTNEIFRNSDNYLVLSESGLDFSESECRTTVCSVNFTPTSQLNKMGKYNKCWL